MIVVNEKYRVDADSGCWIWQQSLNHGYGQTWDGRTVVRAHRLMWAERYGAIADGLELHHTCLNKACCNPDHLVLLTKAAHTAHHMAGNKWASRKLTEADVRSIRASAASGASQVGLARRYKVSPATICMTISGQRWLSVA